MEIESQFATIKTQATNLLVNLERLETSAVDALNLAIGEGSYPPPRRVAISTAAMVIDPRPKALGDIMGRLEVLIDAAGRAEVSKAKGVRGPHRKSEALKIAKALALDYEDLTGRPPDRSENKGGFPDFLAPIFKALGMRDSVESFAKRACEWRKAPSVAALTTDDGELDALLDGAVAPRWAVED